MNNILDEQIIKEKKEYFKLWRAKNKDKVKESNLKYWKKRAEKKLKELMKNKNSEY